MRDLTDESEHSHGDHEKEAGEGEDEAGEALRPKGHFLHGGRGSGGWGRRRRCRRVFLGTVGGVSGQVGRGGPHPLNHPGRSAPETPDLEEAGTSSAARGGRTAAEGGGVADCRGKKGEKDEQEGVAMAVEREVREGKMNEG